MKEIVGWYRFWCNLHISLWIDTLSSTEIDNLIRYNPLVTVEKV